jgi:sortase (surface protein transpeptidase)
LRAPSRPTRLSIPSIGVDTALQPLHLLADGSLEPPTQWARAGWYADGVRPGQVGPAVIAGHIDSTSGPAVFFRLHALRPGDAVRVRMRDGRMLRFVVDGVRRYPKSRFPTGAVYGPTPDPQLRLVTCTGAFDAQAGSYLDNLVVSAHYVALHSSSDRP